MVSRRFLVLVLLSCLAGSLFCFYRVNYYRTSLLRDVDSLYASDEYRTVGKYISWVRPCNKKVPVIKEDFSEFINFWESFFTASFVCKGHTDCLEMHLLHRVSDVCLEETAYCPVYLDSFQEEELQEGGAAPDLSEVGNSYYSLALSDAEFSFPYRYDMLEDFGWEKLFNRNVGCIDRGLVEKLYVKKYSPVLSWRAVVFDFLLYAFLCFVMGFFINAFLSDRK